MNEELLIIMKRLENKSINYREIPEELKENNDIINLQRKIGMRTYYSRGYDVISNTFFIVENIINLDDNSILKQIQINIETFDEYYNYLNGDIYNNSCYYQYEFSLKQVEKYNIDINKINFKSLINYTIDDDNIQNKLAEMKKTYEETEIKKQKNQFWIKEVLNCKNYKELKKLLKEFEKSDSYSYEFEKILIYNFINKKPGTAFYSLMYAINNDEQILDEYTMCLYFSNEEVLNYINYNKQKMSNTSIYRYKARLKKFINNIDNGNYTKETSCGFDNDTNYYFLEKSYKVKEFPSPILNKPIIVREYFYDIKDLIDYLEGDLSNCNLFGSNIKSEDIKDCILNDKTILPFNNDNLKYIINKKYTNELFVVNQYWYDKYDNLIYECERKFKYFFDFIYYLKNDLSNADLIFCEGLKNLKSIKDINFNDSHIKSEIMDKLGLKYNSIIFEGNQKKFKKTWVNEKETRNILYQKRVTDNLEEKCIKYISYVPDIHLLHRLKKCKTKYDIEFTIKDIVNNLLRESNNILLIGGDVSSDFKWFKIFVDELSNKINDRYNYKKIIFILGNHELWDF